MTPTPQRETVTFTASLTSTTWRNVCIALVLLTAVVFGARFVVAGELGTAQTEPALTSD